MVYFDYFLNRSSKLYINQRVPCHRNEINALCVCFDDISLPQDPKKEY